MAEKTGETKRNEPVRTPLVDIFETGEGIVLQFELPGIPKDSIKVDLDKDTLRVETTADCGKAAGGETLLREFDACNFTREFVLSRDLDREHIAASWSDGVLTLEVSKAAEAQPRKIPVTVS